MNLTKIGWNNFFEKEFEKYKGDYFPGRISTELKGFYKVITERGEIWGEISGKLRYEAEESGDYPVIGDFVVLTIIAGENRAIIHSILPRKSKFSRKVAGASVKEQIAASNVDIVFLVCAMNSNFNLRRLERYLIVAWESGAMPVIILSKSDLCDDLEDKVAATERIAAGVPIHVVSSIKREGIEELKKYFEGNKTAVLLGSSGVGKSTLINELAGEAVMDTGEISTANEKGRHTTTYRHLILLGEGGAVIDTPGMRELQLWDGDEGIQEAFGDIENIAAECHFNNCRHRNEPGCEVKKAIREGRLSAERFENYIKLQREVRFIEEKQKKSERITAKKNRRKPSDTRYNRADFI